MKKNNKIRIGNLLKIKDHAFLNGSVVGSKRGFYIALIINVGHKTTTIYFMRNNKPRIKEYSIDELANMSTLLSAKPWNQKKKNV